MTVVGAALLLAISRALARIHVEHDDPRQAPPVHGVDVHSADGWRGVLEPVVSRYRGKGTRLYFRGDAAFANPDICSSARSVDRRMRTNCGKFGSIAAAVVRRVVKSDYPCSVRRYYASFSNQAQSWKKPRRVVAKVEWHPGELYPRVGFIVTNLAPPAERVGPSTTSAAPASNGSKTSNGSKKGRQRSRGRACQCRSFAANAVRLQLHALAYNLGNFMRPLAMPAAAEPWSLTSLREKPIKIGAKVVSHGRYVMFQMAEVAVP